MRGAGPMRLLRVAFWLGVVIYNLPSPASQPGAPESQLNSSQRSAARTASKFSPQPEPGAKTVGALPKRGEPGGHNSWGDAVPSRDTLALADRAVPWCGSNLRGSCNKNLR